MGAPVVSAQQILDDIADRRDWWALPDTDPPRPYATTLAEHGSITMWNTRGCRCTVCIAAAVASRAAYRQARKDRRVAVARVAAAFLRPDDPCLPDGVA